jgi:hypothetical protein
MNHDRITDTNIVAYTKPLNDASFLSLNDNDLKFTFLSRYRYHETSGYKLLENEDNGIFNKCNSTSSGINDFAPVSAPVSSRLDGIKIQPKSLDACKELCNDISDCVGFTFKHTNDSLGQTCELHSVIDPVQDSNKSCYKKEYKYALKWNGGVEYIDENGGTSNTAVYLTAREWENKSKTGWFASDNGKHKGILDADFMMDDNNIVRVVYMPDNNALPNDDKIYLKMNGNYWSIEDNVSTRLTKIIDCLLKLNCLNNLLRINVQ